MARSFAHTWGQIIGNVFEYGVYEILLGIADDYNLYLDHSGMRQARAGKRVIWKDKQGNDHVLDFVFERDGTEYERGTPVAFIEAAWRRYTKHSKNKVQEIQGAILPLVEKYQTSAPFIGAIVAGEFTQSALTQLESLGFKVLYFDYATVITAFSTVGIDAATEEGTAEVEVKRKIDAWESLTDSEKSAVTTALFEARKDDVLQFTQELRHAFGRLIERIIILPLFGNSVEFSGLADAMGFLEAGLQSRRADELAKVEVDVLYSNGDVVRGQFANAVGAKEFLLSVAPGDTKPTYRYGNYDETTDQ